MTVCSLSLARQIALLAAQVSKQKLVAIYTSVTHYFHVKSLTIKIKKYITFCPQRSLFCMIFKY